MCATGEDELSRRAEALCGMGMVDRATAQYERAIKHFDVALRVFDLDRDDAGRAFALYGRGGARRFLGRYRPAKSDLEQSLKLAPDRESEIFTRMALGGLLRMMGQYEKSLEHYQKARSMAGRMKKQYAMAYADCGIGNAFRLMGECARARKHLALADARYTKIGDIVSRPYTLFAISLMDFEDGKPGRLSEAEALFRKTNDDRGMIHVWLARAVQTLASGEKAPPDLKLASKKADDLGLRLEAAHAYYLAHHDRTDRAKMHRALGVRAPKTIFALP